MDASSLVMCDACDLDIHSVITHDSANNPFLWAISHLGQGQTDSLDRRNNFREVMRIHSKKKHMAHQNKRMPIVQICVTILGRSCVFTERKGAWNAKTGVTLCENMGKGSVRAMRNF